MGALAFKLVILLTLIHVFAVVAEVTEDHSFNSSSIEAASYGSSSFGSSGSSSVGSSDSTSLGSPESSSLSSSESSVSSPGSRFETTPEEPVPPPPSSALSQLGPLLSLIQPVLGGILNGPDAETENGATYPPLLKPIFSPLPILPGFGVIPSSLAAQVSDFIAAAAASAREKFAKAARENAARSEVNYKHILNAFNELNMPLDASES